YRALTGADRTSGDIGASVAAARRTMIATSAEAFSPVLFLRGSDSVIFDFTGRRVQRPGGKKKGRALAPALPTALDRPFSLVLGDLVDDRAILQKQLQDFMKGNGDVLAEDIPLSTLTQRCVLKYGEEVLESLFQEAHASLSETAIPPLIGAIARFVTP